LILDEPFSGLDAALWKSVIYEIQRECADKLVILVTHQTEQAEVLGADIWNLDGPPLKIKI